MLAVFVCAVLAIMCSVRTVGLLGEAREVADLRRRLGSGCAEPAVERLRRTVAPIMGLIQSRVDRISGAGQRRADRRTLVLLDAIIRRLRSGASLRSAVLAASDASAEPIDRSLAAALSEGAALRDALEVWMTDAGSFRVLAGTALGLAAEAGGVVAVVLDGVAESLRDRLHLDREVAALASQARASAMVLMLAPIGFSILMAGVDPRVARLQFGSPLGWVCCCVGLGLDVLGVIWMSRLIGRVR